jgi:ABC-type transport system substrate-binding protein
VAPSTLGGDDKNFLRFSKTDSKSLLGEAGFSSGFSTTYNSTETGFGVVFNQLLEATQAQLKEVGIDAELSLNDYTQFTNIVNTPNGSYEGMAFSPRGFYADVSGYLMNMHYPGQSRNYARVDDKSLNALLIKQQRELDESKRHDVIVDIQRYLANTPYYIAMPCQAASTPYGKRIGQVADFGGPIGGYDLGHQIANWWINEG